VHGKRQTSFRAKRIYRPKGFYRAKRIHRPKGFYRPKGIRFQLSTFN
jgi:hypothetical protein